MSGYPYNYTGSGYPSPYGTTHNNYPNYPPNNVVQPVRPPLPMYGDHQSRGYPYETPAPSAPFNSNYSAPAYGISHLVGNFHGQPLTPPMMNQPPQQYGNVPHQIPYPQEASGALYPNLTTPTTSPNYGVSEN